MVHAVQRTRQRWHVLVPAQRDFQQTAIEAKRAIAKRAKLLSNHTIVFALVLSKLDFVKSGSDFSFLLEAVQTCLHILLIMRRLLPAKVRVFLHFLQIVCQTFQLCILSFQCLCLKLSLIFSVELMY